jgi:hypothetical protein
VRKLIMTAAGVEAATGLALIIDPGIVSRLLLGEDLSGAGIALGRVAGFGFVALGLACWPPRDVGPAVARTLQALLTYNVLVTIYLVCLGIGGTLVGSLLWPAAALHLSLSLLVAHASFRQR